MNRIFVPGPLLAALLLASAAALLPGCFPKAQTYGVGNVGGLILRVNPPDATVLVDGVIQGRASDFPEERYLKVESGPHRLELRKAGYETYSREIYVSSSLLRIEATLVRADGPPPLPTGGY